MLIDDYVPVTESGCWIWMKCLNRFGYGSVCRDGFSLAHRYYWHKTRGPIPDGQDVCHSCDVRCCVNPAHMFLGTALDNVRDMHRKGRARKFRGHRKLDGNAVSDIRKNGLTLKECAMLYGAGMSTISRIRRGGTPNG